MKHLYPSILLFLLAPLSSAQSLVYEQPMVAGGGVLRPSQLWIDPSGQNDLDSDAIAWEDFELLQNSSISKVRWWGQAAPPLGFRIAFYNQDPGTVAMQPDIFGQGSGPITEDVYLSYSAFPAGAGLYRFEVNLVAPVALSANTRYFVSIVGRTPIPWATWEWAEGAGPQTGGFWWQRGAHMYFHLPEDRAVSLATDSGWSVGSAFCFGDAVGGACPCGNYGVIGEGCANSTGTGATLAGFGHAAVAADSMILSASHCPATTPGLFFSAPNLLTGLPFGDGLRCVGGAIVRLGVVMTNSSGHAETQSSLSALAGLSSGDLRYYQYWYRDASSPCGTGFNTTNALGIQWQ